MLGAILLRSSFAKKALELDTQLTTSLQCVLAGKKFTLACIRQSAASSLGEVILSLCSVQVRSLPRVLCPGLGSSVCDTSGQSPAKGHKGNLGSPAPHL